MNTFDTPYSTLRQSLKPYYDPMGQNTILKCQKKHGNARISEMHDLTKIHVIIYMVMREIVVRQHNNPYETWYVT